MTKKDIIVIGASSGGIEALRELFAKLPKGFPGSIFVVVHTAPNAPGLLGEVFHRAGDLPAALPRNNEKIMPGRIYVAPPDQHLILEPGIVRLTRGPKENRFRPAVDPLFRSAAQVYGPRAVGVILSGGLDDGTAGMMAIKQLGGVTIVQDPNEAYNPSMPLNAINHVKIDYVLPVARIAPLLVELTNATAEQKGERHVPEDIKIEINIAKEDNALQAGVNKLGLPSSYACPECHGVLLKMKQEGQLRFRCHTGHAYSFESLLLELGESVEEALWNAIRSIEETYLLLTHLSEHLREQKDHEHAERLRKLAQSAHNRSNLIRQALVHPGPLAVEELIKGTENP
ncbi:MAG TPA: chemotaxis protein CheB [Blastocatellia bacterium]|nr:chemotaxis protein CheB [Blastocatellia bacterium]